MQWMWPDQGLQRQGHRRPVSIPTPLEFIAPFYRFSESHRPKESLHTEESLFTRRLINPIYKEWVLRTTCSSQRHMGTAWGQSVWWCCSIVAQMLLCLLPSSPLSHSCTPHAWISSPASCWNLVVTSISSVGVYSFIIDISLTGGCPPSWGCCFRFLLSFVWESKQRGCFICIWSISHSPQHPPLRCPHFFRTPPPSVPIEPCH